MELCTIQRSKEHLATKLGYEYIDTTVKTGLKWLAPTWDMLMRYKDPNDSYGDIEYVEDYMALMRGRYKEDPHRFWDIAKKDKVAFCCYCREGKFCHRLLLITIFEPICEYLGIDFYYVGELR